MGYNSKVSLNAREQLDKFLGIFYPRFSIPKMKFLRQMLYGIQATARRRTCGASSTAISRDGVSRRPFGS